MIFTGLLRPLIYVEQAMESTVQPDIKLIALGDRMEKQSITGFIMMPPPMPLMLPMILARRAMEKYNISNLRLS